MAKNIVICSDGTGNSSIKGRGTNVFKLFEAIDVNGHRSNPRLVPQIAFYDDGVGTERLKPIRAFAGATGLGLGRNVRQLYEELCRIYDPGDRIFLFGFSRGAFTVRTLAGLITTCGVLSLQDVETARALDRRVREAYRLYRRRYRTAVSRFVLGEPSGAELQEFRARCCLADPVPIAFIGVWDTVDAVGLPFHLAELVNTIVYRFKFPDRKLNPLVDRACHALAIDDERHSFHPLLWDEREEPGNRIEQVWFAGAHANVGGGYLKHGMSLVTLDWMMQKAEQAGVRFVPGDRAFYRDHTNVDDQLYDPRSGPGIFYRWKPRDLVALCRENGVVPTLHLSVLERVAHGTDSYAPGNLPPNARVVITPTGDAAKDAAAEARAREVADVLTVAHSGGVRGSGRASLLATVRPAIAVGRVSYYIYLAACVAAIMATGLRPEAPLSASTLLSIPKDVAVVAVEAVTSPTSAALHAARRLWMMRPVLAGVLAGFALSYALSKLADRQMSAAFSQFWYAAQPDLRRALKRARQTAARAAGPVVTIVSSTPKALAIRDRMS